MTFVLDFLSFFHFWFDSNSNRLLCVCECLLFHFHFSHIQHLHLCSSYELLLLILFSIFLDFLCKEFSVALVLTIVLNSLVNNSLPLFGYYQLLVENVESSVGHVFTHDAFYAGCAVINDSGTKNNIKTKNNNDFFFFQCLDVDFDGGTHMCKRWIWSVWLIYDFKIPMTCACTHESSIYRFFFFLLFMFLIFYFRLIHSNYRSPNGKFLTIPFKFSDFPGCFA